MNNLNDIIKLVKNYKTLLPSNINSNNLIVDFSEMKSSKHGKQPVLLITSKYCLKNLNKDNENGKSCI